MTHNEPLHTVQDPEGEGQAEQMTKMVNNIAIETTASLRTCLRYGQVTQGWTALPHSPITRSHAEIALYIHTKHCSHSIS
jgi:hypothetical protein